MIIGIDIDGVLAKLLQGVKGEYKKFSKKCNGRVIIKKDAKSIGEMFGVTREQDSEFFANYTWVYAENIKYYRSAKKYIQKLHNEGHTLYIITARDYAGRNDADGERMRNLIEKSLAKAGIYYDEIFYTSEAKTKLQIINQKGVQVLIDDSYWNIEEISKHIPVICYNQPYNKTYKQEGLRRAKNWKEVYRHIAEMSKNIEKEGKKLENQ